MIQFFAGVLLLAIVFLGLRLFSRSQPKALAKLFRQLLAVVAFIVAIILVFTSRYAVLSLPVGLVALSLLLGWRWPVKGKAGVGKTSSVNTAYFEMTLNHQTGQMDGRIKKGDHEDDRLSNLSPEQLKSLYEEVLDQGDQNSMSLFEAYLDSVIASRGGSTALAAKINEAKDFLLANHSSTS